MTIYEIISTGISLLSLVVAFVALQRSSRDSARTVEIDGEQLKLTHGQLEIDLRKMITEARHRTEDFFSKNADFLALPAADLGAEDKSRRERLLVTTHSMVEGYLSALDSACGKYIDGKIDKTRFKKDYQREIRQVVQNKDHEEYFKTGHAYNALMRVYDEWENPEKGG